MTLPEAPREKNHTKVTVAQSTFGAGRAPPRVRPSSQRTLRDELIVGSAGLLRVSSAGKELNRNTPTATIVRGDGARRNR
jgi:hypothetical protein